MINDGGYKNGLLNTKGLHSMRFARHKAYSIVYLIILIFYLLRPSLPYLEYLLYKDYISKYLCIEKDKPDNCCKGKCFLEEQLKKNIEPIDAERNTNKKILQDKKVEDHLLAETAINKLHEEKILQKRFYSERIIE